MYSIQHSPSVIALCAVSLFATASLCSGQSSDSQQGPTPQAIHRATMRNLPTTFPLYQPMTERERVRTYFSHMFSAEAVLRSAAGAGITQAMNTPGEWGQGSIPYAERFASSFGGHIVQSTVRFGVGSALHEDYRYFQSGETGAGKRLKYALLSTFMARHDDGTRHFAFSSLSGYAGGALISRAWQPPSTSGMESAAHAFAISIAAEAGFNVAREFLPTVFHSHAPVSASRDSGR